MDKTFGELTNDEKKALMGAWVDGETIEVLSCKDNWDYVKNPTWRWDNIYRIKPKPPVVKTYTNFGYKGTGRYNEWYWNVGRNIHCTHKLTLTEIDGVVQPNALMEKL